MVCDKRWKFTNEQVELIYEIVGYFEPEVGVDEKVGREVG